MNRVLIGVIVLIVFIVSLVWVGRRFSQFNLTRLRSFPASTTLIFPSPLPSNANPSPIYSPLPSSTLPKSGGQLPATGL